MIIALLLPSRGLINSRTYESVEDNLSGFECERYFTHNLPIPDAQNDLVERALQGKASYFWFVEEDNIIPYRILRGMTDFLQNTDYNLVAVDYPVGSGNYSTIHIKGGEVMWCGFGCTLVERKVLEEMEKPIFRTDISYKIINHQAMEIIAEPRTVKYGGQDIHFGVKAREMGFKLAKMKDAISPHIKLDKLDTGRYNNGQHAFVIHDRIDKEQVY